MPTYAGVPLTSHEARSVQVVSIGDAPHDWSGAVDGAATLVVLGTPERLGPALADLLAAGRDPDTPVAVVERGTTTDQRTHITTLGRGRPPAQRRRVLFPSLAVVGPTVALRETLSWFETKPLFGWRVLVPRTKEQAGVDGRPARRVRRAARRSCRRSRSSRRAPRSRWSEPSRAWSTGRYEWVGFTSVNAVRAVREKFEEYGLDARAFAGLKIAAVGGVTAAALRRVGPRARPGAERGAVRAGLLEDWPRRTTQSLDPINRVFLPRADIATDTLVAGLRRARLGGRRRHGVPHRACRAAARGRARGDQERRFDAVRVHVVSSTVRNLVGIAGKPHPSTVVACIGPATAKTAEEHGLRVDVLADEPSADALVDALADFGARWRLGAAARPGEPVRPARAQATRRDRGARLE